VSKDDQIDVDAPKKKRPRKKLGTRRAKPVSDVPSLKKTRATTGPESKAKPAKTGTAKKKKRSKAPTFTVGMSKADIAKQYTPYVRSIAGKIWKTLSKDIEFDDLVSYGMLGLLEAADRFDPKFGANFMTFSYYRIRGAIYDGLRGMGWVSRSEYQKIRFEKQATAYLNNVHDRQMAPVGEGQRGSTTDDEINQLADVVGSLVTIYVTALDAMEGFQIKDETTPALDDSVEIQQSRELVQQALEKLPEQERKLLKLYYYGENSLEEVGKHLGLSKSWTSRLHARSIDKLSRLLKDLVDEHYEVRGTRRPETKGRKSGTQPSENLPR
jgi:RNA polymerase sigma factor for flagellar operon FliA